LIIETANKEYFKRPILELRKKDQIYKSIVATKKTPFTLKIAPTINKKCKFYLERKNKS